MLVSEGWPQPYTCALRMVNQLDYTVINASRENEFITAEKHRGQAMQ